MLHMAKRNRGSMKHQQTDKQARRHRKRRQRAMHNAVFIINFTIIFGAISGTYLAFGPTQFTTKAEQSPYTVLPIQIEGAAQTRPTEIARLQDRSSRADEQISARPTLTKNSEPARENKTDRLRVAQIALPKPHPMLNPQSLPPAVAKTVPKKPEQAPGKEQVEKAAEKKPATWTKDEIIRAQNACRAVLAPLVLTYTPSAPIKKGACGDPAPITVSRIGASPGIELSPPATLNCRMTARLAKWLTERAQPAAREMLKSEINRIRTMSSYACRNRYNRPKARLSEHALANALDIGAFRLADGRNISVLRHWGPIQRVQEAALLKSRAAQPDPKSQRKWLTRVATTSDSIPLPKKKTELTTDPPKLTAEARFLRSLHASACKQFGTVLGPEANKAHENHFHFDLAPRRRSSYCE